MLENCRTELGPGPLFHLRLVLDTNEVTCDPPLGALAQQIILLFETVSTALSNVSRVEGKSYNPYKIRGFDVIQAICPVHYRAIVHPCV